MNLRSVLCAIMFMFISIGGILAQKEANIWYFGEQAGLDFIGGSPVFLLNSAMNKDEGCSSISDSSGNLLFYTSGLQVWNRNHVQMPNGFGLAGHESSTQSALIVPKPGSGNLYYIFTTDAFFYANGLRYTEVDMNLQGGLGNVTTKNVLLHTPSTEKITAVKHSNNTDIWVISHAGNSDVFHAYLVTSSGISSPVSSAVGTPHTGGGVNGTMNAIGSLKASPDGTMLALTLYNLNLVELFIFNNSTGVVAASISFPPNYPGAYGVEFSPDHSKLYFTSDSAVFQADLSAGNNAAILNSVMAVGSITPGPFGQGYLGALQLGPDGKIYGTSFFSEYLFVINIPDAPGIECNFVEQGIWLGGKHCYAGLPGFVQSLFFTQPQYVDENHNTEAVISIFPNPCRDNLYLETEEMIISAVEILNTKGVQVFHTTPETKDRVIQLAVKDLLPGIYLIKVITPDGTFSRKFMKIIH